MKNGTSLLAHQIARAEPSVAIYRTTVIISPMNYINIIINNEDEIPDPVSFASQICQPQP